MFLQTPFRHEIHSDVQERIKDAFETGCEFREIAACFTQDGDIVTFQLLFLPVKSCVMPASTAVSHCLGPSCLVWCHAHEPCLAAVSFGTTACCTVQSYCRLSIAVPAGNALCNACIFVIPCQAARVLLGSQATKPNDMANIDASDQWDKSFITILRTSSKNMLTRRMFMMGISAKGQ